LIISEMQHKLAAWAESDPNRRFDRLLRLIADRKWLAEAARIVLASSGARTPGIDGMDKRRLQDNLGECLEDLRIDLLKGTYAPKPVKRIYIPKANGKLRPLGIPTLTDRIVQRAMLMVMEPIWESDFHRLSYGFRPERSVHHAVRTVKVQLQDGSTTKGRWIIEGDLASYFDTVQEQVGRISKCGDAMVRAMLYEAANVMMTRCKADNWLKSWALGIARRRGARKAKVALARRLAVVLHRMWSDETEFSIERPAAMNS